MNKSFLKMNYILSIMNNSFIKLPTPININMWWNFGSLLGIMLSLQIITGLFLTMHYCANISIAFNSLIHIIQDTNYGWLFRLIHMNGASMFFILMYIHIGRSMYYGSYSNLKPWMIGIMILFMSMGTAFMGYVLPWGQMSFWGATVITNLISTIPYMGLFLVEWIWGGFSVNNPTLNRFYTFHFIMPFFILLLVIIHLMFIHETGSNNPLGINSNLNMAPFNIYFTLKDMYGFIMMLMILTLMMLINPYMLSDPENFMMANSMITPIHIQPEWYFLFAYTILRSIPNKLGGVMALLLSILILFMMPMLNFNKLQSLKFYPINQIMFWYYINIMITLTWLGSQPVEPPYIIISQIITSIYFSYYTLSLYPMMFWDYLIK